MVKILRFLKEYIKWSIKGQPIRQEEKISELFAICSSCENFEEYAPQCGFGSCKICGCNINKEKKLMNKLAWGTTVCPDNPPRWS